MVIQIAEHEYIWIIFELRQVLYQKKAQMSPYQNFNPYGFSFVILL